MSVRNSKEELLTREDEVEDRWRPMGEWSWWRRWDEGNELLMGRVLSEMEEILVREGY